MSSDLKSLAQCDYYGITYSLKISKINIENLDSVSR